MRAPAHDPPFLVPAFTLLELLVSTAVLALMVTMFALLFNGAAATTTQATKRLDADAQARNLLDRIAVDLSRMPKRPDLDLYLKDPIHPQPGNDQLAFFCEVPGFYPGSGSRSPLSLVAYRVNTATLKTERFGVGLLWNGVSPSDTPIAFLPLTIADLWPTATNMDADDGYELAAPCVFRMEYFYQLRGQIDTDGTTYDSTVSTTPWDTRIPGHTSVNSLEDVAAIIVVIAVVDARSRTLVPDSGLKNLAATMPDFETSMGPGGLQSEWQTAIDNSPLLPAAASGIRIYRRSILLNTR